MVLLHIYVSLSLAMIKTMPFLLGILLFKHRKHASLQDETIPSTSQFPAGKWLKRVLCKAGVDHVAEN